MENRAMTTTTNGPARQTLASQLDRLDRILDGLAEGLNEAVAHTVQQAVEAAVRQAAGQAVREAVQAVLTEVLTNPDLQAALHAAAAAPPPPPVLHPVVGALSRAWGACRRALRQAATFVGRTSTTAWRLAREHLAGALVAGGAAVAVAAVAWWASPALSAAAGWCGGVMTTRFAEARAGLRRLLAAVE
jgi:hypothetical protein